MHLMVRSGECEESLDFLFSQVCSSPEELNLFGSICGSVFKLFIFDIFDTITKSFVTRIITLSYNCLLKIIISYLKPYNCKQMTILK